MEIEAVNVQPKFVITLTRAETQKLYEFILRDRTPRRPDVVNHIADSLFLSHGFHLPAEPAPAQ